MRPNSDSSDAPERDTKEDVSFIQPCVHDWIYQHADEEDSVYCVNCGAEPSYTYVVVEPSGEITQLDDPGNEPDRISLISQALGEVTDETVVIHDPFIVSAVVNDNGLNIGLAMQRNRLLKGLAGYALLRPGSALGADEEEWDVGRGFSRLELSVVKEMLEEAGVVSEPQAERLRQAAKA